MPVLVKYHRIRQQLSNFEKTILQVTLPLKARSIIFTARAINGQQLAQISAPLKSTDHKLILTNNILYYSHYLFALGTTFLRERKMMQTFFIMKRL